MTDSSHSNKDEFADACVNGDVDKLLLLIQQGVDVSINLDYGTTGLHMAAFRGHSAICLTLIDHGAEVNPRGDWGESPLHQAVFNDMTEAAGVLIDRGADVEAKNKDGKTPMALAAEFSCIRSCLMLIAHDADRSKAPADLRRLTPRQAAARGGFSSRLIHLLSAVPSRKRGDDAASLKALAQDHGQHEVVALLDAHLAGQALENTITKAEGNRRLKLAHGR